MLVVDDVYVLANRLFDENFPILQDVASSIVEQRVKDFLDSLKDRFIKGGVENLVSFANPDMQYSLYEAMKEYSKYGDNDLLSLLVNLIFNASKTRTIYV